MKNYKRLTAVLLLLALSAGVFGCMEREVNSSGSFDESSKRVSSFVSESSAGSEKNAGSESSTEQSRASSGSKIISENSSSKKPSAPAHSQTSSKYDPASYNVNTDWFMNAKYGIFVHYLEAVQNNPEHFYGLAQGKNTTWDECVNDFNVNSFAKDANDCGAGYVIFTIMQASKYMIAPNETYNQYTGYKTGEACSTRDLIADLIKALDKYNIKLMLYFTGDGPRTDAQAAAGLNVDIKAGAEFRKRWFAVAREYSIRYGNKIHGWWIDGAHLEGYNDNTLKEFSNALKAGNPKSIVAFNPGGADIDVRFYSLADDYTAGERNSFEGQIPKNRFVNADWLNNRVQWHVLSYLGSNWGSPDVAYTPAKLKKYISDVTKAGGVVSIDVGVYRDGTISPRQVDVLASVKKAIR